MDSAIDLSDAAKALDLENIRFQLIRLEDTITFHMIERAQFPLNATIYKPGGVQIPNSDLGLFDWILREQERLHSLVRRYESLDEHAFFPDALQKPLLKPLDYPKILHPNNVNVNEQLKQKYINLILPRVCTSYLRKDRGEQKENYGSTATCDVACLQALSRRIHFGKFVAESKFREETAKFVELIQAENREGIRAAITNTEVEASVLDRLRLKAKTYGTDPSADTSVESHVKINVGAVVGMYKEIVIPMTKDVEVEYLLQRLEGTQWQLEKDQ